MRDLLVLKKGELRQRLSEEQKRLEQVERLLNQIEKEGTMPEYNVVINKDRSTDCGFNLGNLAYIRGCGRFFRRDIQAPG
jgi:hypothetical protein